MAGAKMLNIGCGAHYHPDWLNLDVSPVDAKVLAVDITKGLPFASGFATVCYSSHVLEHLDKAGAANLIGECFRVLQSGGVVRLVLPDLEVLAREYLRVLAEVTSGDKGRDSDYDWLMLELYDQTTRNYPGGEMAPFLASLNEKARSFVRARIGVEAEKFWEPAPASPVKYRLHKLLDLIASGRIFKLAREKLAGWLVYLIAGKAAFINFQAGIFRGRGEIHQWMYDRYSLPRLLEQAGFINIEICAPDQSRIPDFGKYSLDVANNEIRKPDSFYIEAAKP